MKVWRTWATLGRLLVRQAPLANVVLVAHLAGGCIQDRCTRPEHCLAGQICLEQRCIDPDCVEDEDCGPHQACYHYQCIPGCRSDNECAEGEVCIDYRCRPWNAGCECPLAPSLCAEDINPRSDYAGETVCLPSKGPAGVALFFGSVGCSICRTYFASLVTMKTTLEAEGLNPMLVFVQVKSRPATADDVGYYLPQDGVSVVADSATLEIATTYGADWYHFVIVDANMCIATHIANLGAASRSQVLDDWRAALQAQCPER